MSRTHNGDLGVPYEHNKIKEIPPPQYKGRADLELLVSRDGVKRFIDFCVARAILSIKSDCIFLKLVFFVAHEKNFRSRKLPPQHPHLCISAFGDT
jgi:hypothetical protein